MWPNGANGANNVYRSRIGMWGRDFDWYHFLPARSTLTPQVGGRIGGSKLDIGIAAKRRQIEQKLCIERYWEVVGRLSIGATRDPLTLP